MRAAPATPAAACRPRQRPAQHTEPAAPPTRVRPLPAPCPPPQLIDWALLPRAMLGVLALLCGNGYIVGINQVWVGVGRQRQRGGRCGAGPPMAGCPGRAPTAGLGHSWHEANLTAATPCLAPPLHRSTTWKSTRSTSPSCRWPPESSARAPPGPCASPWPRVRAAAPAAAAAAAAAPLLPPSPPPPLVLCCCERAAPWC